MNKHLQDARSALDAPYRMGGQPSGEKILVGMHEAIKAILDYLEESDKPHEVKPLL